MKAMKVLARILLASIAYVVGMVAAGILNPLLHLPTPKSILGSTVQHEFVLLLLASPLLALALLPLASGLKGSWMQRCSAIAVLIYVTLGINTALDAKIYTGLIEGSPWLALVSPFTVLPSLFAAAALTFSFGGKQSAPGGLGNFGPAGWGWRLFVAWLSFPVIYLLFGMCIAPIVVPYYQAGGILGLRIPGFDVIIPTQLVRSALFLAASFPVLVLWTKSRGRLIFALGLAHAMTVGAFQLAQAWFLPMVLRVTHSIEIGCDSFVYAAVLAFLFVRLSKAAQPMISKTSAAA